MGRTRRLGATPSYDGVLPVHREVLDFIARFGSPGVMPTRRSRAAGQKRT